MLYLLVQSVVGYGTFFPFYSSLLFLNLFFVLLSFLVSLLIVSLSRLHAHFSTWVCSRLLNEWCVLKTACKIKNEVFVPACSTPNCLGLLVLLSRPWLSNMQMMCCFWLASLSFIADKNFQQTQIGLDFTFTILIKYYLTTSLASLQCSHISVSLA